MNRYYFSKHRDGKWHVHDRVLKHSIALCNYREQASLISNALNYVDIQQDNAKLLAGDK